MSDAQVAKREGHLGYLIAGFTSLLVVAFLDNARGPLIPVLIETLKIPYETAGLFLTLGNLSAILATFVIGRALPHFGERRVAIWVGWISIFPGLFSPWVSGKASLLFLGMMLGAVVAMLGSLCSILAVRGSPPADKSRYLSFQQVMYGVGSLAAPLAFSGLLKLNMEWWWLLVLTSLALFALTLSFIFSLPPEKIEASSPQSTVKGQKGIDRRGLIFIATFAFYVGGEVLTSMWMSSLLVDHQGKSPAEAAKLLMIFFVLIALTRFLCFLWLRARFEQAVIFGCLLLGITLGFLGQQGYSWALPAMGLVGPFFPLCMARISTQFPKQWQQMMIHVYTGMQIMLALMHLSVGKVADSFGIGTAFLLAPGFFFVSLLLLILSTRMHKEAEAEAEVRTLL